MTHTVQNLYILEDDVFTSNQIADFLENKFPNSLKITTFIDAQAMLKSIDYNTDIVIIDYDLKGEKANILLSDIKKISSKTEVIILSSKEDIAEAIAALRSGAKKYVIKGENSQREVFSLVYRILNYPVRILLERFKISKILAIFISYFIIIGVVVYIGMRFLKPNF
ncbi:response regulator [Flavobacterium sp.]|uniref:response regulator n=1 Tax=Flavobacterium sp. TaxID=239 RepID=UPI0037508BAD